MVAAAIVGFFLLVLEHCGLWALKTVPLVGIVISGPILLVCLVWYLWPVSKTTNSLSVSDLNQENPPIPTLFLQCMPNGFPHTMPESGVIWQLQLQTDGATGGALSQQSGIPGSETGAAALLLSGYRCEVTNYSANPVANVEITLDLITYEAIPTDNGFRNGPQSIHKEIIVRIPKIDTGKDSPFIFYIFNMAKQFMEVRFLEKTTLTVIGETKPHDGVLQQSYLAPLHLPPRR